jgi:hypothetical protein
VLREIQGQMALKVLPVRTGRKGFKVILALMVRTVQTVQMETQSYMAP